MRERLLKTLYKLFPFSLQGDCRVPPARDGIVISCVINFFGRLDLLEGILYSLAEQRYPRERFEVLLVEDRGGTEGGRALAEQFSGMLPVVYLPLSEPFGQMGHARNYGLAKSRGEVVLFLDDDTVIMQKDFLAVLDTAFHEHPEAGALVPHGSASFALLADRYCYHDPFFMTSRCTAYRRAVLAQLFGFMDDFIGQEDVEFVVRFHLAGKKALNIPSLGYFHPPLLVNSLKKPMAVGRSFYNLKNRYPVLLWLLVLLNCGRHAPLWILPGRKNKEMGKFGLGFLGGIGAGFLQRNDLNYQ